MTILSSLNVSNFGEKASVTPAVTAVIYTGTAQSLNSLARDLLARAFTKAVIRVPAVVYSRHVGAGLQRLLSFPVNSELV